MGRCFLPQGGHYCTLINIEALYSLKNKTYDDKILIDHNALYTYWKDSTTYDDKSIKIEKCSTLSREANKLMSLVFFRINEILNPSGSFVSEVELIDNNIDRIDRYCKVFLDSTLCFMHSKASLEISSFKNEKSLSEQCQNLYDTIVEIYYKIIGYSSSYHNGLLTYMLFEKDDRIQGLLEVIDDEISPLSLLVDHFETNSPINDYQDHSQNNRQEKVFSIHYQIFDEKYINNALRIANILYRIGSVQKMLTKLRNEDIGWESSTDSKQEIKKLLNTPL